MDVSEPVLSISSFQVWYGRELVVLGWKPGERGVGIIGVSVGRLWVVGTKKKGLTSAYYGEWGIIMR